MEVSSKILSKLNKDLIMYIYDFLNIDEIIKMCCLNTNFRLPLKLNKFSITVYFYLCQLMRLYTRECYCYLLSNEIFHNKLKTKFQGIQSEDLFRGKVLGFVNILERYEFDIDIHCVNYSDHANISLFYKLFEMLPAKYKEKVCVRVTQTPYFDPELLSCLHKIKKFEIVLDEDSVKHKIIDKIFDSDNNYFFTNELVLKTTDTLTFNSYKKINDYFFIHHNCLVQLDIESRTQFVELNIFSPLLIYNQQSLSSLKVKAKFLKSDKSLEFIENLGKLLNLTKLIFVFENQEESLDMRLALSLNNLEKLTEEICFIKFQRSKNILYEKIHKTLNLGEYYDISPNIYNEDFFNYFTDNNELIRFEFNFDKFDTFSDQGSKNVKLLENFSNSFVLKDKLKIIKIKSKLSNHEYFLNFIKSLKK